LRDLDAPHLRALARIRAAEDAARDAARHDRADVVESAGHAVKVAAEAESAPVRAALIRTGVIEQETGFGGGMVYTLSEFGRRLLADLDQLNAWS
jgi:hypothetical protein